MLQHEKRAPVVGIKSASRVATNLALSRVGCCGAGGRTRSNLTATTSKKGPLLLGNQFNSRISEEKLVGVMRFVLTTLALAFNASPILEQVGALSGPGRGKDDAKPNIVNGNQRATGSAAR